MQAPESTDQSLLITLVANCTEHSSRILAIMFSTRDMRNAILSGFRYCDIRFFPNCFFNNASYVCVVNRTLLADANLVPGSRPPTHSSSAAGAGVESHSNPMGKQRSSRRLSLREVMLEEKMAQAATAVTPPPLSQVVDVSGKRAEVIIPILLYSLAQ